MSTAKGRRAVVVDGARTPFVKAFTDFTRLDTIALGVAATKGLLRKTNLGRRDIESIVWGGVILPGTAPNVGREICLDLGLDPACEAMTVTRACASGLQAITLAAAAIERGDADVHGAERGARELLADLLGVGVAGEVEQLAVAGQAHSIERACSPPTPHQA